MMSCLAEKLRPLLTLPHFTLNCFSFYSLSGFSKSIFTPSQSVPHCFCSVTPLWVGHWPQSSPSSFSFFSCTPGFYTLVSSKHHLVGWCLFNGWTSVQVGSRALKITQKIWTIFLGSSLNLSICCGCNTKSLELCAGFKPTGKINSTQAAPLPSSSSNSKGNTR